MRGHLKVTEIYDDHQEVVVDDCNMLTDGLSVDLVNIMTGDVGFLQSVKPAYLQVGTSTIDYVEAAAGSSLFFQVSSPLSSTDEYGNESYLRLKKLYRSFVASSHDAAAADPVYSEMLFTSAVLSATTPSSTTQKEWFAVLEPKYQSKVFIDSFEVRLKLGKDSANGQVLTEFGLFSKNTFGYKEDRPLLIAYKKIGEAITKRPEFELLVEWSIGFIGNSKTIDTVTPGQELLPEEGGPPPFVAPTGGPGYQGWSWVGAGGTGRPPVGEGGSSWQLPGYIPNVPPGYYGGGGTPY